MLSIEWNGLVIATFKKKKKFVLSAGGAESSLKLMPVTLVPTEILNTSPCVLSRAGMRSTAMPFLGEISDLRKEHCITLHIPGGNKGNIY